MTNPGPGTDFSNQMMIPASDSIFFFYFNTSFWIIGYMFKLAFVPYQMKCFWVVVVCFFFDTGMNLTPPVLFLVSCFIETKPRLDWNWSHSSRQPLTLQWYFNNNSYSTQHSCLWHNTMNKTSNHRFLYHTIISIVYLMNNVSLVEFLINMSFAWRWGNSVLANTHFTL